MTTAQAYPPSPFPIPGPFDIPSINVALLAKKDGDLSTTWTCSGDPQGADDPYYDCNIYFNLYSYRHVKQVKIGESLVPAGVTAAAILSVRHPHPPHDKWDEVIIFRGLHKRRKCHALAFSVECV